MKMLTPEQLNLSLIEVGALIGARGLLDAGILEHVVGLPEHSKEGFNMRITRTKAGIGCGSIMCIGGLMATIMGKDDDEAFAYVHAHQVGGIRNLFFPNSGKLSLGDIEPWQAVNAIDSFLYTGKPNWAMSSRNRPLLNKLADFIDGETVEFDMMSVETCVLGQFVAMQYPKASPYGNEMEFQIAHDLGISSGNVYRMCFDTPGVGLTEITRPMASAALRSFALTGDIFYDRADDATGSSLTSSSQDVGPAVATGRTDVERTAVDLRPDDGTGNEAGDAIER